MKDWFKRFLAVDNSINEQSVIGLFWTCVSFGLVIAKLFFPARVELELVYMALGSSLLAFGIGGFKKF